MSDPQLRPDVVPAWLAFASLCIAAIFLILTLQGAARMYSVPWVSDAGQVIAWLLVHRHFVKLGRLY